MNKWFTKVWTVMVLYICACYWVSAQNYSINQNQQTVNINLPVIEKKVYVDKYRTIYVPEKRIAKKLDAPVTLHGFLCVYPEDLGDFKSHPLSLIRMINNQHQYGRSDWRIPSPDELAILEQNAELLGLGDDIYMATDHSNGVLRLVATINSTQTQYPVTNMSSVYWMNEDYISHDRGSESAKCPFGYRLPTSKEFKYLFEDCYVMGILTPSEIIWTITDGNLFSIKLEEWSSGYGSHGYAYYWVNDDGYVHAVKLTCSGLTAWHGQNYKVGDVLKWKKGVAMSIEKLSSDTTAKVRCIKSW